jgi:epoxyqueuosine reductase
MKSERTMSAEDRIKAKVRELGFSAVGIARAVPLEEEAGHLEEWIHRGYQATMTWMARRKELRVNPCLIVPGAKSVIAVAMNYYTPSRHVEDPAVGKISRYAWGTDYHEVVSARLDALWQWLRLEFPGVEGRWYVDTGPVMDKVWAQRAGIGWIGKHTNVITGDLGSWIFLGELITTLDLSPDAPATDHCGTCTLCIEACPTHAITEPYVVDSARCLSYLTIEHRGEIDGEITGQFENWIYGCDICQDVCPWNQKFAVPSEHAEFLPRQGNVSPVLTEWRDMTRDEFTTRFRRSAVKRTKWAGLMRNIAIVLEHAGLGRARN